MGKQAILWMVFLLMWGTSCSQNGGAVNGPVVVITTPEGEIRVRLYEETPQHRDNFLKLVREGYYDGVLFHRVIRDFMIQAGDPESRNALPGVPLGNGGPGYTVPAEIVPALFHKKGALAAARLGDQVNPEKASSGSQFYLVEGKVWRSGELDTLENRMNATLRQSLLRTVFNPYQEELNRYRQENNQQAFNERVAALQAKADSLFHAAPKTSFSEAQRQAYTTIGGSPHLDGGYTVFGEVIDGLEVISKISATATDGANRPLKDVAIKIKVVE